MLLSGLIYAQSCGYILVGFVSVMIFKDMLHSPY